MQKEQKKEICIYKLTTKIYDKNIPNSLGELKHIFECIACDGHDEKCKYYSNKINVSVK